jgi:hypothetical protein
MSARTHSRIEFEDGQGRRAGVERSELGGRAELGAGGASAAGAPRPHGLGEPGGRPELPSEVAEEALALARMRRGLAGGELAGEVRDRLSDELIDELLAGARSEEEIVRPRACWPTSRVASWSARWRPS